MKALRLLTICLIIGLGFSGCEKSDKLSGLAIGTHSIDEFQEKLFNLAESFADLMEEYDFRNFIYKQVEQQVDGDYNVLVKKVSEIYDYKIKGLNFNSTINFFDSIKKYPQIYIPFYESIKNSGKIGSDNPVVVIYTDENEKDAYEGYKLGKNHDLHKLDFFIDEEFARNNEVWVFSINERVDENGDVRKNEDYINAISLSMDDNEDNENCKESNKFKSTKSCTPPGTPSNTEALPLVPYSVRVKWQDIQGVAYYKVFAETNYSGFYSEIATIYPNQGSTYLDQGKTVGSHYDYQIQAYNASDCYSARSFGTGTWVSWRTNNYNDILNQIYISDGCWNWCCGWPEGKIELRYRIVKYNKSDQQIEYPKNSLPQKSKSLQKGKWCIYDKELFRWDVTKYAYNYMLFFYEDDGGDDKGTTIKFTANFKPSDKINLGAEISFTIDDRDEELGWVEIYHFDPDGKEYSLAPRKGTAKIKIRQ